MSTPSSSERSDEAVARTTPWRGLAPSIAGALAVISTLLLAPDGNREWLIDTFEFLRTDDVCGPEGWKLWTLGLFGAVLGVILGLIGTRRAARRSVSAVSTLSLVLGALGTLAWLMVLTSYGCDI